MAAGVDGVGLDHRAFVGGPLEKMSVPWSMVLDLGVYLRVMLQLGWSHLDMLAWEELYCNSEIVVQSFIKGHRKSGVISTSIEIGITNQISPHTVQVECLPHMLSVHTTHI